LKGFNSSTAVIQLGLSGKWPNDLCAVQRIKAAFYLKIAESLSKQFQLTVQPYPDCVHVLKVSLCQILGSMFQKPFLLRHNNINSAKKYSYSETSTILP